MGGAGALLNMTETNTSLVEQRIFKDTSRFLHAQKLFFNGVLGDRTNLASIHYRHSALLFVQFCTFMDGKFSLKPAFLYMEDSKQINFGPVPIEQLFTAGNILEDSLQG